MTDQLFLLPGASEDNPDVEAWFAGITDPLRLMAREWFALIRSCGPDTREVLHDGFPTACVADAAFAYVAAYKTHAAVGFFHGVDLPDPAGLLEGSGKRMRHVKLKPVDAINQSALAALIAAAYGDIQRRLSRR